MILKSDPSITQQAMDAILFAIDGGVLDEVVTREEARHVFHVSNRQLEKWPSRASSSAFLAAVRVP